MNEAFKDVGFEVVLGVLDGFWGIQLAFFGFGSDEVKTRQGATKILEGLIQFLYSHQEGKHVEVGNVIQVI